MVRDVPIRGVPVELHVIRYRYRCPKCKRTFSWRPPEIHPTRPTTLRLDDWIWGQALRSTFADVAEDVGVHKTTILRTFMAEYKEREHQPKRRVGRPTKLAWLGIDEVYLLSIKRSQRVREGRTTAPDNDGRKEPQCILTDVGNGQVVVPAPGSGT
ncbi:MAG: hypothetical protein M3409_01740 [Gemmatimonadota bacterium]|nr:hypothetical protein [Gemmatimonadota bacterium]